MNKRGIRMNNYKIFLRDETGKLVETGQIVAESIQDVVDRVSDDYDVIGKIRDERKRFIV